MPFIPFIAFELLASNICCRSIQTMSRDSSKPCAVSYRHNAIPCLRQIRARPLNRLDAASEDDLLIRER